MFDLADQLSLLREQKSEAEHALKAIAEKLEEIEYKLSEVMAETETQNFTRSGIMFYLTTKTRASAVAGSKEELYDTLKQRGFGDLVYETVNANSLSAFVKEQIGENDEALPGWLAGLVTVFDKTSVAVRKAPK